MSAPYLVIFDCDGTLVDGQHMVVAAMERAFLHHGLAKPNPRKTRGVIGLSLRIAVARVLGAEREEHAGAVTETFKEIFHELRASKTIDEPFYDGAKELVSLLSERDDVLLAIATGKSRRGVDAMLEREGWHNTFVSIQTADSAPSKPDPGMIENALRDSGAERAAAFMIGDTTFDMEMARAASVNAFGVAWGYHPVTKLAAAGAHLIADDYPALKSALLGHFDSVPIDDRAMMP